MHENSTLIKRLKDIHLFNFNRISDSISLVNKNRGIVKVADLANATCLSDKQYYRIFKEFVGVTPKQFLRTVRLQWAFYNIQTRKSSNLTDLAYNCGYFDQAHFNSDFKLLTGYTPKKCFENTQIYSDYFAQI